MSVTHERLSKLRALMKSHSIDYYFIPARDEHNNEYVPAYFQRRAYLSGFTGSAGDLLIGQEQAYLWTDPRYFLQAEQQLDTHLFTLMRQQQGVAAPIHEWLGTHAIHKRVGTDPKLISIHEKNLWAHALQKVGGELVSIPENCVDAIWHERPSCVSHPIFILDPIYTGRSVTEKLQLLREQLQAQSATAHALNLLDAIAWLFNIRGSDVAYNPLALSYALITVDAAFLFIHPTQVPTHVQDVLHKEGVTLRPYDAFAHTLQTLQEPVLLEHTTASWWIEQQLVQPATYAPSPITLTKAIKNSTEQAGMQEAHRRDGIALCKLFYWLKEEPIEKTELDIAKQVLAYRAEDPHFRGPSFNTIAAYGDHGAIIHYAVNESSNRKLGHDALLLIDSGGHYLEGTTDVTRTIHLGIPTALEKKHYTLVLKGHLALRRIVFPHGTCGEQLNAIAHQYLWAEGLDFGHGTGHGVGCYLCVHEGPHRIGNAYTQVPLVPGMILSNEPGLYLQNHYGIRIENVLVVVPKYTMTESLSGHGPFYGFQDLTLYPYERNLLDFTLLAKQEIEQINQYHKLVYEKLCKDLPKNLQLWLEKATQPL